MNKKELKRDSGITLIALIITIIILVILAAVSIRVVYNMGIIGHAVNGIQDYARGAKAENAMLNRTGSFIEDALDRLKDIQEGTGAGTLSLDLGIKPQWEFNIEEEENDSNSRVLKIKQIKIANEEEISAKAEELLQTLFSKEQEELEGLFPSVTEMMIGQAMSFDDYLLAYGMNREQFEETVQQQMGISTKEYIAMLIVEVEKMSQIGETPSMSQVYVTFAHDDGTIIIEELYNETRSYLVKINGDYTIKAKDSVGNDTLSVTYTISGIQEETFTVLSNTSNVNYPENSTNANRQAVIPKGFAVMNGSTKNTGIVITDEVIKYNNNYYSVGNEFVWVPVEKAYIEANEAITTYTGAATPVYPMAVKLSDNNYRGILYDFAAGAEEGEFTVTNKEFSSSTDDSYDYNVEGYKTYEREPGTVSYDYGKDYSGNTLDTTVNTIGLTQTTLQTEYNNMVNNVSENGGFYVARYELSYNNGGKSQRGKQVASADDEATHLWYGLYDVCKNMYNTNNVQSMMISGSQYCQIMLWMIQNGEGSYLVDSTGKGNYGGTPKSSGRLGTYSVLNIYDLAGNLWEWTCVASSITLRSVYGEGYRVDSHSNRSPGWFSGRHPNNPHQLSAYDCEVTARPTIYLKN